MPRRKYLKYSRLSRKERKKYTRQTFLLTILTIFLLIAIIFWGIPSLIKLAIFLSDLRSSSQPISGEDTIPPSPPVLQPLPDATSSAVIRVEGFAEEGSTLVLFVNRKEQYELLVESDGEFLFNKVKLNQGKNEIKAKSIDSSGNESQISTAYDISYDNLPPNLEVSSPSDGASFYGASEKNLRVTGKTDEDSTVRINGSFVIISQDGSFSYTLNLNSGENNITITASDKAGNTTTETITINYEE